MKKYIIGAIVFAVITATAALMLNKKNDRHHVRPAIANAEQHNTQMNACIKAALEKHPGAVLEVELEKEEDKLNFDVDVQGSDGKHWETECDAGTGQVTEDKEKKD